MNEAGRRHASLVALRLLPAAERIELALGLLDSVLTEASTDDQLDIELLRAAQFAHLDLADALARAAQGGQ